MIEKNIILKLIDDTYIEISKFKKDVDVFSEDNALAHDVWAIETALTLFQLGVFRKRAITEQEEYWFQGGYYIHYDLDGRWEQLANNYSEIVSIVKQNNYFRSV